MHQISVILSEAKNLNYGVILSYEILRRFTPLNDLLY